VVFCYVILTFPVVLLVPLGQDLFAPIVCIPALPPQVFRTVFIPALVVEPIVPICSFPYGRFVASVTALLSRKTPATSNFISFHPAGRQVFFVISTFPSRFLYCVLRLSSICISSFAGICPLICRFCVMYKPATSSIPVSTTFSIYFPHLF